MKKSLAVLWTACALCLALCACGKASGGVSTDGSTSMSRVICALGEAFEKSTGTTVTYNATGSGSGIQAVMEGRCDIGLSSRDLTEAEKKNGLQSTVLARDGIVMVVNPQNPVKEMDLETIAKIFTGEITNWQEVGGANAQIVRIGREAGSGTRDGFETITDTKENCDYRQVLTSNGDVITTVANNPNAIGYVSLAAVKDSVKTLSVAGVEPTEDSVKNGSYPIMRPFLLVTRTDTALSESAQAFVDYVTSDDAVQIIADCGAVPVN